MQNGTYKVRHKALKTDFKIVSYNGRIKLINGKFSRFITEEKLHEMYNILEKVQPEETFWNIKWYVDGREREHIQMNAPYAVCRWKIKELERMKQYKTGKLIPERA